ncbi:T9SS type A sorting domain-containing protein [Flavobacterium sp. 7A]|uniref:T9SS type A sorting domain-containing protein n=1 Tax=Flavobacterium sp. 7A TaxID=2940571 RepID=UPI0022264207|nr:T9SS type A sorting domain-containing protein [Flavobacterium sp. 7A]MCW2119031.1 beta-galactosidase [Flavobacterium sp. 7A]
MKYKILPRLLLLIGFSTTVLAQTAQDKIVELQNLMSQAESKGIDTYKEKMTVRTAEIFSKYATYDENHVSMNKDFFDARYPFPEAGTPNAPAIRPTTTQLANDLPTIIRNDVITILDESIDKMNKLLLPDAIIPSATPVVDWANVSISGNKLMNNGKPVFLLDHSFKPDADELTEFYGDLGGAFISLSSITNSSGVLDIQPSLISSLSSQPTGNIGHVFLSQAANPSWLITASKDSNSPYYGMVTTGPLFTKFDIDHPQARPLNSLLLSKTIPYMVGKNYSKLGVMLTNEPHWFTAEGSFDVVPISQYTKAKFVNWLQNKHQTIATLNSVWGSSYTSIDAAVSDFPFLVPLNLQGSAKWYDWMTFNQFRVTDWFTFLDTEVKKQDPTAKNHLKLIPSEWSTGNHDHGLDFESLTNLSGIIGNDAGSVSSIVFGNIANQTWVDRYGFNWRDFAMPLDFMTSVSPDKLVYDTESHFQSRTNFRDMNLSQNYTRTTHWLATLHGMNAAQNWVWFRNEDGSYQSRLLNQNPTTGIFDSVNASKANGYSGSTTQLPKVLNEVTATVMDLNTHSEIIDALQHLRKSLRIFYSETSAINDVNYMDNVFSLYESLYFNGIPLGFATQKIIQSQPSSNWDVILVYNTKQVTIAEFNALQGYLNNGGTVIIDNLSLQQNEYSQSLENSLSAGSGSLILASSLADITNKGLNILSVKNKLCPVTVSEVNGLGADKKGVAWRGYSDTDGVEKYASLSNIGKTDATVTLGISGVTSDIAVFDMISGERLTSKTFVLQSEETRLLKLVKESDLESETFAIENSNVEIYPNPTSGPFTITFKDDVTDKLELEIFTISGKKIFEKVFESSSNVAASLEKYPAGIYFLKAKRGDEEINFKLIKNK